MSNTEQLIRNALEPLGDPERAIKMATYTKDRFEYLGIMAGPRRQAQRPFLNLATKGPIEDVWQIVEECWAQPEREFQYVGADLLRKNAQRLSPDDLPRVRRLIETKSWWDTVDSLATHVVGAIVKRHDLGDVMDEWIDSDNIWVARTAILHQLFYKRETDADRLFEYCNRRAADTEFFIRKALGWALRQYARVDPDGVKAFVDENAEELSGLTKREALKHVLK